MTSSLWALWSLEFRIEVDYLQVCIIVQIFFTPHSLLNRFNLPVLRFPQVPLYMYTSNSTVGSSTTAINIPPQRKNAQAIDRAAVVISTVIFISPTAVAASISPTSITIPITPTATPGPTTATMNVNILSNPQRHCQIPARFECH